MPHIPFVPSRLTARSACIALALLLSFSVASPPEALAGERIAANNSRKKSKKTLDGPQVPVQFHTLIQPQLDPWIMQYMRPWLVPGRAAAKALVRKAPPALPRPVPRATVKKTRPRPVKTATRPAAVLSALPGASLTLSPRFSPMGGNKLGKDVTLGFTIDLWPSEQVGIEFNMSAFPMSGADNTQPVAQALLSLLPIQELLEATDRVVALTASLITAPVAGTLAPPGVPPLFVEFLVGIGGGFEVGNVEMLACPGCTMGEQTIEIANAIDSDNGEQYVRPVANLLIGSRIFPKPGLGLRADLRFLGGPATVLDFDDDWATDINRGLIAFDPLLNRIDCATHAEMICKTTFEGSITIEFGIDISLGAPRRGTRR
jgi:hypothetical protein